MCSRTISELGVGTRETTEVELIGERSAGFWSGVVRRLRAKDGREGRSDGIFVRQSSTSPVVPASAIDNESNGLMALDRFTLVGC